MKILHGTWIPEASHEFIQTGNFYLWIETSTPKHRKNLPANRHQGQLAKEELALFLANELGLSDSSYSPISRKITSKYFLLPSANQQPLPSLELSRYLELEPPETSDLQSWEIDCYQVNPVIKILNDIHFISLYHSVEIQIGSDLLF